MLVSRGSDRLRRVSTSQCGGSRKLVVPASPSYLLQKLLNVGVCTGTQMPKAGQTLAQKADRSDQRLSLLGRAEQLSGRKDRGVSMAARYFTGGR